ncbi:MAG: DUF3885 domain-containing protein [Peptococcaceae bacterium]|jgi:hypothetical protein|nr:DUF3885 domain-containing protein [Peptococcaceae bacterium]
MNAEWLAGLYTRFPGLKSPVCLRLEFGSPLAGGSDKRFRQIYNRSWQVVEQIFGSSEHICLLIKDWDETAWREDADYVYRLLAGRIACTEVVEEQAPLLRPDFPTHTHRQTLAVIPPKENLCRSILQGIAHCEQGREPEIGQNVYWIKENGEIIFYMYDDCRCVIYADAPEKIRYLYDLHQDWVEEYWREDMQKQFDEQD